MCPQATKAKLVFIICLLLVVIVCGCKSESGSPENLLLNKTPIISERVNNPERITDGERAYEGADWSNPKSSVLSQYASLVYDLGKTTHIDTLLLQGDNNDHFRAYISDDNINYQIIWDAQPVVEAGLRTRHITSVNIDTRYLKFDATNGDGSYSISEISAYSTKPNYLSETFVHTPSVSTNDLVKSQMLYFGMTLVFFLFFAYRGAFKWWLAMCALLPIYGLYQLISVLMIHWPPQPSQISLFRGLIATVAAIAILREILSPKLLPANTTVIKIILFTTAILSFASFYNLGHPQFMHQKNKSGTYIHYLDLRQYFPTAKYFPEVGYRDIYIADMAALLEDNSHHTLQSIGGYAMRDLRSHEMKHVRDYTEEIGKIKTKFSAARWQEYKSDARYIRELMGDDDYFRYLIDYGGNATPVWISQVYLLFNMIDVSDTFLLILATLDPLFLLLMFICIWRSFGLCTMLVSMVVFGANDFIMYGTNWGGAILRHDWMFYIGFGICALKTKRLVLGGVFLGAATMIRAFPFFAFCGIGFLALWWLCDYLQKNRRLPSIKEVLLGNLTILKIAAGATGIAITLFLFSSLLLSFEAWVIWWDKIHLQQGGALANHFGLRSLLAGWNYDQKTILHSRQIMHISCIILLVGLIFFAARRRSAEKAAILGLLLMWIIYYPQNYYIHFIIFLPLLVDSKNLTEYKTITIQEVGLWLSVLLLCTLQYFPTLISNNLGLHFYFSNVFLSASFIVILLIMVKSDTGLEDEI